MKQDTLRKPADRIGAQWPWWFILCWLAPALVSLVGCTASWRAPVETRGTPSTPPRPAPTLVDSEWYRVQRGDTLFGIAWQSGVDYRLIAAWNRMPPPYRIYPGQRLRLKPPPPVRRRQLSPPVAQRLPRSLPATRPSTPPVASQAATAPPAQPAAKPAPAARRDAEPAPQLAPEPPARPSPRPPSSSVGDDRLQWGWPAQGPILSHYDARDPARKGVKIGGRDGNAIQAAESGRVVYSGSRLIGYGRLIIVKHNDKYLSAYGHNKKILVQEGDQVTKGQKIAEMGQASNGDPVLHFEIRRDGEPVDPLRLLPRR